MRRSAKPQLLDRRPARANLKTNTYSLYFSQKKSPSSEDVLYEKFYSIFEFFKFILNVMPDSFISLHV